MPKQRTEVPRFLAITVLVALEIVVIAILTAIRITGVPAVIIVVIFALLERLAYVRWFKRRR
ncbi:hypothetical protein [Actinomadura montaniterrae]|uniref:Uncharacterized protein n=1 Tax=Actinomadura montaniterrae TaxID=1803903 RepID=A0A6L3WA78_9ACTN|nr:hypothetical protein [Actinomadura montaniterrae]KAB2390471.1 hypothetical protein F9B16_01170 [Actinomadura montaniterrae]